MLDKPQTALVPIDASAVKQVLARYEAGEEVRDICKDYGVSHVTVYKRVIEHAEDAWKAVQVARAMSRKEEAERELDSATDALTLARGRERLKAAQWDLERVCRRIYGQTPEQVLGQGLIQINIGIARPESINISASSPDSGQLPE